MKRVLSAVFIFSFFNFFIGVSMADPVQQPYTSGIAVANPRARAAVATPRAGAVATPVRANTVAATSRGIATRTAATPSRPVAARTNASRAVRARTGIVPNTATGSRVSVVSAGGRGNTNQILGLYNNRYNVGTYANVIDPNTGMIAADAYANCMESYYACMDEICTARNPGQRRCACADRVKTYTDIELQLEQAKTDLIRLNGELVLLELTKGGSVAAAFQLTEAEQAMNCVSYRNAKVSGNAQVVEDWCTTHLMSSVNCSISVEPAYCKTTLGDDWNITMNGMESNLSALMAAATRAVDGLNMVTGDNLSNIYTKYTQTNAAITGQYGASQLPSVLNEENSVDELARTWGYDLFAYANNNVCNRVLDACFNGIYETCGSHSVGGGRSGTGPYNYNSQLEVENGSINFVTSKEEANVTASQNCFKTAGYAIDTNTEKTRPLAAAARRSILQKYALDANADCDVYGEELKVQAQNASYLRVAATQAVQELRMQYAQDNETANTTAVTAAKRNYTLCLGQMITCYNDISEKNPTWTLTRVKSACNYEPEAPACFQPMVCDRTATSVISTGDNRNDVFLSDILATAPENECVADDPNAAYVRDWNTSL